MYKPMYRYGFGPRREKYDGRRWRPRSRAAGCLLWFVLLIVILIVLALMFGGFQKGTKYSGLGTGPAYPAAAAIAAAAIRPLPVSPARRRLRPEGRGPHGSDGGRGEDVS
jgi:hypothetical protein